MSFITENVNIPALIVPAKLCGFALFVNFNYDVHIMLKFILAFEMPVLSGLEYEYKRLTRFSFLESTICRSAISDSASALQCPD